MSSTGFDRRDLLAIAAGGVLGAALRWSITRTRNAVDGDWFAYAPNTAVTFDALEFPFRVLAVNLLGTFVLGALLILRTEESGRRRRWLAGAAGFCGSLTTFSTFATDVAIRLAATTHDGALTIGDPLDESTRTRPSIALASGLQPVPEAGLYLLVSVLGGATAFAAGRWLARRLAIGARS